MADKIRVGVAGVGFIGIVHVRAFLQIADAELVAIADPDDDKAEAPAAGTWIEVPAD